MSVNFQVNNNFSAMVIVFVKITETQKHLG